MVSNQSVMEKRTYSFFTIGRDGEKAPFYQIDAEAPTKRGLLRNALSCLAGKARDIADFLYIKGRHIYFWDEKVVWE